MDGITAAREHVDRRGPAIVREMAEFAAIPNVSRDLAGVRANADWIVAALTARGVDVRLSEIEGVAPLVIGHLPASPGTETASGSEDDLRNPNPEMSKHEDRTLHPTSGSEDDLRNPIPITLGLYVHYDGQPVEPVSDWTFPPFEPTLTDRPLEDGGTVVDLPADGEGVPRDARLYARGTGDDKAPIVALLAALDALTDADVDRTIDLVLAFEGEEEIGSPHLDDHLAANREALTADVWIVCDGPVHHSRRPQVVFGVRGYTEFELTTYGASHDLHSGHYGNWIHNPALTLAHLLASMRTGDGEVTIADYEADTSPVSDAERRAVAALPDDEDQLRHDLAVATTESPGTRLVTRLLRPSLNIRGLASGGVGDDARNVVPSTATASVDIRLAAGDDPEVMLDRVEAHLVAQGAHVTHDEPDLDTRRAHPMVVRLHRMPGYAGVRTPLDDPTARRIVDAVAAAHGQDPVIVPTFGGSVPMHGLSTVLGAPLVIVPIANHDDNQHAPDENLRLGNLLDGVVTMASLLTMAP